jgi:hypothetical protein
MPRRNKTVPHQAYTFVSHCQKKRRFSSEKEAKEAADIQMTLVSNVELGVYKCELCGGWHLTSKHKK